MQQPGWGSLPEPVSGGPGRPPARPSRRQSASTVALAFVFSILAAVLASLGVAYAVLPGAAPAPSPTTITAVAPSPTGGATAAPASPGASDVPGSSASRNAGTSQVVDVAARVSPAVVTITNSISGSGLSPFSIPATGVGSGFIIRADGWIVTNNHVVAGNSGLTVELYDGRQLPGKVMATDPTLDLAIIKIDAAGLPVVGVGKSATLQVGQLLIAIGSPLGTFTDSVTSGILSATGRSITVTDDLTRRPVRLTNLLQTDTAINPGNSGGPLLDGAGKVIGINVALDQSAEGIGFAIPIDDAQKIIDQAVGKS